MTRSAVGVCVLAVVIVAALVFPSSANAALITFNSRPAFNAAAPGLPVEDFQNGNIPVGATACPGPFNSATNNACFSPGDLLPGISYAAVPGPSMVLLGPGIPPGFTTLHIGPNAFADAFDITMSASSAIGFDLGANAPGNVLVSVFDGGGILIAPAFNVAVSATSTIFLGLINTTGLIGRVNLSGPLGEVIDNVAFGQPQTAIPEPASLLLLGAGVAALRLRRRVR